MDLQDFKSQTMYFEHHTPVEVEELIRQGSESYGTADAEGFLRRAFELAPDNLNVLVALYRFYYYQHRLEDALDIASHVLDVVAPQIDFPPHWRLLNMTILGCGLFKSFTMVRFYLLCLKGAGYLNLRMGNMAEGVAMLNKVIELDTNDRMGARALMRAMGPAAVA